jgi:hypothetical protein
MMLIDVPPPRGHVFVCNFYMVGQRELHDDRRAHRAFRS